MKGIVAAGREVWGLFFDDNSLALGLLIWCGVVGLVFPIVRVPLDLAAMLLFIGCTIVLLASLALTARRNRAR